MLATCTAPPSVASFLLRAEPALAPALRYPSLVVICLARQVVDALAFVVDISFDVAGSAPCGDQRDNRRLFLAELRCPPFPWLFKRASPEPSFQIAGCFLLNGVSATAVPRPVQCMTVFDQP